MIMNFFHRQQNHPIKSEQSVEVPLNRSLSSIPIVKSSVRFFAILVALAAIIGCGDGITGQVGGIGEGGSRIAFTSERDGNPEIYIMNSDGSEQTRLTDNDTSDTYPALSPDGSKIAFVRTSTSSNNMERTDIYVMDADGSEQTILSSSDGPYGYPSWSPDGSMIAFSSWYTVFGHRGHYLITVISADGQPMGWLGNFEEWANSLAPSWSSDGSQIAFSSNRGGNYEIYTIDTECVLDSSCSWVEELTQLTEDATADSYPSWSPDGSKIAFDSSRDGNLDIYVMNADGSEQTRLTSDAAADYYPSWSPDGSYISFSSYRDGNYNIYVMNADGSEQTRLTESEKFDYGTSWSGVSGPETPDPTPTPAPTSEPTPIPTSTPAPGSDRLIPLNEELTGTISEAGEFEPWLFTVDEDTRANVYMYSETGALDTYLWVYEGTSVTSDSPALARNDDNNNAVVAAVSSEELTGPAGGPYNSAIMQFQFTGGTTYSIVPRSYADTGTGGYHLKVVRPAPIQMPTPTPPPITPTPVSTACTETEPSGSGPSLNAIAMNTGYPRQLLAIDGDTNGASVIWGTGTSFETEIVSGQGGTRYFQIPPTSGTGIFPVALRTAAGTSNIRCVTVRQASGVFPAPRVQYIGLNGRTGNDLAVTVSAANLDQDATMTVNGTVVAGAYLSSGLPLPYLLDHIPATYGYPIYHYGQLRGLVEDVTLGSTLNVVVTNSDGNTSSKSYTLPDRWEDLDSDSDGLLDAWEDGVYTSPSGGTINLAAMGTDKYKKDMLVEAEWVAVAAPGTAMYDDTIWSIWKEWKADMPFLNPDGSSGLNLIVDRGQGGAFTEGGQTLTPDHRTMGYGNCGSEGYVNFMDYKNDFFNNDRSGLFHYLILGKAGWCGASSIGGEARFPLNGPSAQCPDCGGDNLFVVCTGCSSEFAAGIVAHEMGHDIGLSHGGLYPSLGPIDHNNDKPNSRSIMNYRWTVGGVPAGCGQDELARDTGTGPKGIFGQGMLATIDERNVDESVGICDGVPIDFNGDGQYTTARMNTDNRGSIQTHEDTIFDQVGNLILDFRACWEDRQGLVRRATCE